MYACHFDPWHNVPIHFVFFPAVRDFAIRSQDLDNTLDPHDICRLSSPRLNSLLQITTYYPLVDLRYGSDIHDQTRMSPNCEGQVMERFLICKNPLCRFVIDLRTKENQVVQLSDLL